MLRSAINCLQSTSPCGALFKYLACSLFQFIHLNTPMEVLSAESQTSFYIKSFRGDLFVDLYMYKLLSNLK